MNPEPGDFVAEVDYDGTAVLSIESVYVISSISSKIDVVDLESESRETLDQIGHDSLPEVTGKAMAEEMATGSARGLLEFPLYTLVDEEILQSAGYDIEHYLSSGFKKLFSSLGRIRDAIYGFKIEQIERVLADSLDKLAQKIRQSCPSCGARLDNLSRRDLIIPSSAVGLTLSLYMGDGGILWSEVFSHPEVLLQILKNISETTGVIIKELLIPGKVALPAIGMGLVYAMYQGEVRIPKTEITIKTKQGAVVHSPEKCTNSPPGTLFEVY